MRELEPRLRVVLRVRVDLLPARQRDTLELRYYLDLPDDEMARLIGVSPSTVRSAAHEALNTLARSLKEL